MIHWSWLAHCEKDVPYSTPRICKMGIKWMD